MANSGTKLHGSKGAVYIGGTFVSNSTLPSGGIRLAVKSEWTLQRNRDYVDATSFGDTNKTYLAGLPNVQGTFAGFLDTSGDLLLRSATSDAQQIFLYADDGTVNADTPILVAYGPAFLDANVTVANNDAERVTGDFRASGAWTITL